MANISGKTLLLASRMLRIAFSLTARRREAWFSGVKMGPPDPILGITEAFKRDKHQQKINLGVGAYRDDDGKPWVLPSVRCAEERIFARKMDHEYSTIIGIADFYGKAIELALGKDSRSLKEQNNATGQSISGTGALRVGAAFLSKFWTGNHEVYVPMPTWGNHIPIFEHCGLTVKKYRYYDAKTLDFKSCLEDICKVPAKSIVLLHACAHNPTGVDPTVEQWCELSKVMKEKQLYPFFDMAYQGFVTGDVDHDAQAVRIFERDCHRFCLAQSFPKNMGLYGERVGAYSVICEDKVEATRVLSQIKIIVRAMYSNPPIYAARIVSEILHDQHLKEIWLQDVKTMADRIIGVRALLKNNLIKLGSLRSWEHITQQFGMFCFSGMTPENVDRLAKDYSIFLTKDGRISVAGVTTKNVEYLAQGMHEVTK